MMRNKKLEKLRRALPQEEKILIDHSFAISDRITEIIERKNISQRQLAELLGKKESEVSKWLRGTHNFTLKTIAKLEAVLQESIISTSSKQPGLFVMNIPNGAGTKTKRHAIQGK